MAIVPSRVGAVHVIGNESIVVDSSSPPNITSSTVSSRWVWLKGGHGCKFLTAVSLHSVREAIVR